MKVFFDYSIFTLQRYGGASNYIVNLTENFSEKVDPLIISLFYKNLYLKNSQFSDKVFFYNRAGPMIKYINKINKLYFNYKVKIKKPDIIHLTYYNNSEIFNSKSKIVVTEYDLIKEKLYTAKYQSLIKRKKKIFNKIDQIICISKNTKKDLQQEYNIDSSKISVINLAINKDKKYKERYLNIRPFILYVGNRQRYKNFINAIKAYSISDIIKSNFDFVCFGGGTFSKSEEKLFKELNIDKNKIHFFEGDNQELNFFYQKARLFIFPSLYEGFGLPLLEAMNMECPVICSNNSCFPEIANDAAIFFDPKDIDSIKSQMEKVIFDDRLLLSLKTKGNQNLNRYSWKKCSNETEQIYEKII
jgi:glycosyltransferase involved in cell wall biosynthesis|tara:strand:- start:4734 stop:5810 length:1077 start_codon:yes stop_codon:yes gene_type:complete